ncbi:MAG: PIG-L family deacetylase [Actinomycetota bacterium]|jgi:LmbE family N-acetylglucosaminyl deacetylase|nr:PIG-L family deacetylase [Actinomycetota bacterium]
MPGGAHGTGDADALSHALRSTSYAPPGSWNFPKAWLPGVNEALAVCAHPDDESFGLGGVLDALSTQGTRVRTLCFTHGEASSLGKTTRPLGEVRAEELSAAAGVLGIDDVKLFSYPDGRLTQSPLAELALLVDNAARSADLLVVFDEGGITGHPDHCHATAAAVLAASSHRLPVLAWTVPADIANQLNEEFNTTFVGRLTEEIDIVVTVNRNRQRAAIACHASQSSENPVLWRRLELSGHDEHLRWLAHGQ